MKFFLTKSKELRVKNEKGQVLVMAIIIMAIALAIGVTVSSRYMSTLKNISESDN